MAKRTTSFERMLPPRRSGVPTYRWLYSALRADILEGRLGPGARLPATRDLAGQYGLSRGTVVSAFDQLKAEGYVEGDVGSGTYVSKVLPEELLHVSHGSSAKASTQRRRPLKISEYCERTKLIPGYKVSSIRAFRPNLPAVDLFPIHLWAQITARCLRRASANLLIGSDSLGHLPLRQAVAQYLITSRGVKCVPEQVAIVSGVQEALDLVARIFLDPGDQVCIESPGYFGASRVFKAIGAELCRVAGDDEGLRVQDLPKRGARLVYVTPAHQFPLGTAMSLTRRLQLLEWARKSGALIFEDDYDSEFRYSGRPIPALQGLDSTGTVIYAGSFSKVMFPSLRLGYLVIPSDLVNYFEATKSVISRHAPLLEQVALAEFITEGHFGRHIRHMRSAYAERLSVLIEEAQRRLTGLLEISSIEAGLQTTGWLRGGIDCETAANAAAKRDVTLIPLSRYGRIPPDQDGLHLGFAAVDTREIRRGVRELAIALESVLPK